MIVVIEVKLKAAEELLKPVDIVAAVDDVGIGEQFLEQRNGGLDAFDDILAERPPQPHQAFRTGLAEDDELADQAVIIGRNPVAGIKRRIDPDAEATRYVNGIDKAWRWREGLGILGIDPALDGMAGECDVLLREGQFRPGRDADLLLHQIVAGDHLGDRVLDLEPRVHLDEIELAILIQELDRAGAAIAELRHGGGDALADLLALRGIEPRRQRLLPDLLVTALQRAVALAEMHGASLSVAEHLDLDVAGAAQKLLDIDRIVAERGLGFALGGAVRDLHILRASRHLHAAAAAAGSRLDENRIADLGAEPQRGGDVGHRAVRARHHRNAENLGSAFGLDLVAHRADVLGTRADEGDAVLGQDLGEARVLGEEAIARMHRLGPGDLAGRDDGRNVEIAVARRGRPMHTLSSASRTCIALASAVEWTATVEMPSSRQARSTRRAISPRLAIKILSNITQ